jgi:enoyl-CoA hydratase
MGTFVTTSRPAGDEGIATVTLHRVDRRNALSIRVRDEMSDTLDTLAVDGSLRVVIIDAEGPVFSAGFDLKEFEDDSLASELAASSRRWHERLRTFPLPLIASVQGPALAGGFDLATMCDLRIAGRSATFARPELRWTVPIYSVVRDLLGGARARELAFTNPTLPAEEALAIGLVNRVVEDHQLAAATLDYGREVAARSRDGLLASKATAIAAGKVAHAASFAW